MTTVSRVPLMVLCLFGVILANALISADAHDDDKKASETCPADDPDAPGCKGAAAGAAAGPAAAAGPGGTFDIGKYGGKAGTDITKALTQAWDAACATTSPSKVVVPKGDYDLGVVELGGPCKAPTIAVQMDGTFKAPEKCAAMKDKDGKASEYWVKFCHVDGLTFSGTGVFDGRGQDGWGHNKAAEGGDMEGNLPYNFRFDFLKGAHLEGFTSLNSKKFHMGIFASENVTIKDLTITAPGDSPNTDGMHISKSTGVTVTGCKIGTGDDCISIGGGVQDLNIDTITCGPGHGISVGSLGKDKDELPVQGVHVKDCNFDSTDNGVRIKTWIDSQAEKMSATDMHFEGITLKNVTNPIVIDQAYCPRSDCKGAKSSTVKISDVSFTNIKGTAASPVAMSLVCSSGVPCEKIVLSDIDITYQGKDGPAISECLNIKPDATGKVTPPPCTKKFVHPDGFNV